MTKLRISKQTTP